MHRVQAYCDEREGPIRAEQYRVKGSFNAVSGDRIAATGPNLRPATQLQPWREIEKNLMPRFKGRPNSKIAQLGLTIALMDVEARGTCATSCEALSSPPLIQG